MKKIHLFTLILLMASPQLFAAVIGAPVVASDPPDPTLFAAAPSSINTSTNDNRVYAGLKWSLSGGIKPEAVLGFRHANINSSGDTDGGDISISAKFMDGFQPGQYELNTLMVKKTCKVKWAVVMTSLKVSLAHWACMPLIQILG